jgi:hypothetical protein
VRARRPDRGGRAEGMQAHEVFNPFATPFASTVKATAAGPVGSGIPPSFWATLALLSRRSGRGLHSEGLSLVDHPLVIFPVKSRGARPNAQIAVVRDDLANNSRYAKTRREPSFRKRACEPVGRRCRDLHIACHYSSLATTPRRADRSSLYQDASSPSQSSRAQAPACARA